VKYGSLTVARPKKGAELGASATIGVRLPPDLRAKLEDLAQRHGRSLTEEVRVALAAYAESDGSLARPARKHRRAP
jgi:predicted DNA-binding protein